MGSNPTPSASWSYLPIPSAHKHPEIAAQIAALASRVVLWRRRVYPSARGILTGILRPTGVDHGEADDAAVVGRCPECETGMARGRGRPYLQVTAGKRDGQINKSWVFCYTRNQRGREMGLGSLNTVGLSQAREEAGRWRGVLKEGRDPIEVRNAGKAEQQQAAKPAPAAVSFERCAILYMAAHEAGWRNAKHRQQWNNTLATYAYPVIGALAVDAIDTKHVTQILGPIWTEKNETASRVRGRIVKILDWAHVQKYRTGENPARWTGHLEHLPPVRGKVHKVENQPALPWEQVPEFMRELRRQEGLAANCRGKGKSTATSGLSRPNA